MKVGDLVRKKLGNKGDIGIIDSNNPSQRGFTVVVITAAGIRIWMEEYIEVISEKG